MLAKIALTLAVIAGVWFLVKKAGSVKKVVRRGAKEENSAPEVVDLEPCPICGGYHQGGADNCPSSRSG